MAVDQRGIPFPVNASAQGIIGLNANELTMVFTSAVTQEIANKQSKGLAVARYDADM